MPRPSHSSGWRDSFATTLTRARPARSTLKRKPKVRLQACGWSSSPIARVVYQAGDGGVVRTESRAGKVVRHETYSLSSGGTARFELRDEGPSQFVVASDDSPGRQEPGRAAPAARSGGDRGKDRAATAGKTGGKPR